MMQRGAILTPLQGNGSPSPQQTIPALMGSGASSMGCLKHGAFCSLVLLGLLPAAGYL